MARLLRPRAAWLAMDLAALACGLASLAVLGLRAVWLHLGMITPGAMVSGVLPLLAGTGLVLAWGSKLRAVRAGLRQRADRRILLTAASVLLFSGYVSAVLALAVMGRHELEVARSRVQRSSIALAGVLAEAIDAKVAQAQDVAQRLLPAAAVFGLAKGPSGASSSAVELADAIDDLDPLQWAVFAADGTPILHVGGVRVSGASLPLRMASPGDAWLLRESRSDLLSLRLRLPVLASGRMIGSFQVTLPFRAERTMLRLVPEVARGEMLICPSRFGDAQCFAGVARRRSPSAAASVLRAGLFDAFGEVRRLAAGASPRLSAYAPIGDSGLRLALRVPVDPLLASLIDAQREVAVALPLLALFGLALLAWQLRPVARRLHQSEARLRSAVEESGLGVLMFRRSGRITLANAAISDMLGYSESELLAMDSVLDLVHPQERVLAAGAAFAQPGWASYCAQRRYRRSDGTYISVRLHVSPVLDERGVGDMAVAFVQDVSAWLASADAFRREHAFLRAVLGQMREGVVAVDEFGRLRYVNDSARAQLGYAADCAGSAQSWRHRAALHELDMRPVDAAGHPLRCALEGQGTAHEEVLSCMDGSTLRLQLSSEPLRDDLGNPIGAVMVTHDITESSDSQRRLLWLAYHDPLTGLPNRHLLVERLRAGVERIDRDGGMLAVLFVDLDRFKTVNESLGHDLGDSLLIEVSSRLLGLLGPSDTLARLGGDDFVVVLGAVDDAAAAARAAERLLAALAQPVRLARHVVYTGATAGIALHPGDGDDVELLLKRADAAMFQAKQSAPGSWRFFGDADARAVEQRLELEGALRAAVGEHAFELRFQPKVDVSSSALVGAEALLRWTRPGHGEVPPGVFIPLLEDMGLISAVGEWVLDAVCAQQARWIGRGLRVVPVAVNCSARQFQGRSLVEPVASALRRHAIPGVLLQIELTESVLMQGPEAVAEVLEGLLRMGVESSIDDFGTGYSSLAYLKRLPVRSLKIDREFIHNLPGDAGDAAIVDAILALARALRLKVVAEGVESSAQLAFLRERGCDEYQGYWFRPPLQAAEFAQLLQPADIEAL